MNPSPHEFTDRPSRFLGRGLIGSLRKRLKIHENEIGLFLWLALFFFLTFFVTALFRNYTETAFLKRYGPDSLPLMFVINGLLTIAVFKLLGRIESRSGDRYLFAGILLVYAAGIIGLFFLVQNGTAPGLPGFVSASLPA